MRDPIPLAKRLDLADGHADGSPWARQYARDVPVLLALVAALAERVHAGHEVIGMLAERKEVRGR